MTNGFRSVAAVLALFAVAAELWGCGAQSEDDVEISSNEGEIAGNRVGANKGIMWGVNVHPGRNAKSIYQRIDIEQQVKTAAALGLRHIRVNISESSRETEDYLVRAVVAAKANGIVVTPVLTPPFEDTGPECQKAAYQLAFTYARKFRGAIPVWEIDNELNHPVIETGFDDNSDPKKFQLAPRYQRALGKVKGLIAGVRAADETAKVAFGDSGGCNYGFTQAIYNDGVRWDITVMHGYDFFGDLDNRASVGGHCAAGNNMLAKHAAFGKPVWVTEFNFTPAVTTPNKHNMGVSLGVMMDKFRALAEKYDVEEADVYELYDESDNPAGAEQHFGLYGPNGEPTEASSALHAYVAKHPSAYYDSVSGIKTAYLAPFSLSAGHSIIKNGLELVMQSDGNLVLGDVAAKRALFATETHGHGCKGGCAAKFQSDGNLTLYENGKSYWTSLSAGKGVDAMIISSSGAPVLLEAGTNIIWKGQPVQ